ncbi:MAG TPA: orotidine-5'-phosphate decarboxylase [Bacteroidales bacterium]|nr:orotidine-5'-phosphate decarboxylase [Bacteroidales bacterium]
MDQLQLLEKIREKKSFLCIGLDTEPEKIPAFLLKEKDPVFEFNRRIIDATHSYCIAYKPNVAFYECNGPEGWKSLKATLDYIRGNYPGMMVIADAKRGDIGNTSKMYARTFFGHMDFDAVTVAPYMGEDSVKPFLEYGDKWVIILALTSNRGADDFQYHTDGGVRLFERVLKVSSSWGSTGNIMYVVGATRAAMLEDVRKIVPGHFLLIPGVGAQGGSLKEVASFGMNDSCGLLVNSSRAIIFADNTEKFAATAGEKAQEMQAEMAVLLKEKAIL